MKSNEDENSMSSVSDIKFWPPLYIQRYQKAFDILTQNYNYITKIADFGCAEGKFVRRLKKLVNVEEIALIDSDDFTLDLCLYEARPLNYDFLFGRSKELKLNVFKGSVSQRDSCLKGFDAITCLELIEHLSADVLSELPQNIFGFIKPKVVIITTPNIEYNVLFPELEKSKKLRHWDHKFEWTRSQFNTWCHSIISSYPEYTFETTGVGEPPNHLKDIGFCTQIAIFTKISDSFESEECVENYCNYKLIESYKIEKSRETQKSNDEPYIDWDSVLTSNQI